MEACGTERGEVCTVHEKKSCGHHDQIGEFKDTRIRSLWCNRGTGHNVLIDCIVC